MIWSALESVSVKSIQFLIGILLARILSPNDYGIIGVLMVFIMISGVFIDSGFTTALIHKKERTEKDIATVFVFNLGVSIVFYIILFFSSSLIEEFYQIDGLGLLLRVLALSLILNATFTVPTTLLTIKLDFKSLAKINLTASLIAGSIAIVLALNGLGVWALIAQALSRSALTALIVYLKVDWKPSLVFSIPSFKSFFAYGSNILASAVLNRIVDDAASLLIAKYLTTKELGYYSRGIQFNDFISSTVSSILNRVLLPGLVSIQDNIDLLVNHTKRILKLTSLFVVPIFFGLFVLAKPIVIFLLTEKWLMAVPIMQIFCFARLVSILSGVSINLLYVIGKPNLVLRQQYIKIPIRILSLVLTLRHGILYIAVGELVSTVVHFFINTYYPGKIMNYGGLKQLKDLLYIFIMGMAMAISIHLIIMAIENNLLKILVGFICGVLIYAGLAFLFQRNLLEFIIQQVKNIRN